MQKFYLFKKSNKFYLSNNKVIYSILFILCIVMFLRGDNFDFRKNIIDKVLGWLTVIVFGIGGVLKFISLGKYEQLNGKLEGFLIFENELIKINDEIYPLGKIKKIQITNNDYSGRLANTGRGNLNPVFSNGVDNFITLFLLSGETKRYQYELVKSNDFQKVRAELINYHIQNKIEFWTLANILGEENSEEIAELTKEIEKLSTTANNR